MSQDSSDAPSVDEVEKKSDLAQKRNWWMLLALPAWVFSCFFAAQIIGLILFITIGLYHVSINNLFDPNKAFSFSLTPSINSAILDTMLAAAVYFITIALAVAIPWLIKKSKTSWKDLGISRYPSWMDILITPAGFIVYIILSAVLVLIATHILPGFDVNQTQNVGFSGLSQRYEYILAFVTLVLIAPLAEEILFRGYLFGKLKKYVPVWAAVLVTSLLFGAAHGNWNVIIDTFALSVVLCVLRELTGNIWSSILLHMVKNGIAFYILFIYPTFLTTLVK